MVFSIIQKSQLEGALRLDAEYYQPEYLSIFNKFSKKRIIHLGDFCRIADGDHAETPPFVENGKRYLRAKELQNFFIDSSYPVFISNDYFQKIKRSHIKPFDIVLSIMGTVGNISIVLPNNGIVTANRAVAIISPKSQEIFSSYFLVIYLESKFGVLQRERESMGGVQLRVNLDDLSKIKIPVIEKGEQKGVDNIFKKVIEEHYSSRKFYSQAENLLLEELGLKDFKVEDDLFSIVNLSDIKKANRIDAEYFQAKFNNLLSKVKTQKLGDLVSMKKGFEPGSEAYQENGKLFIRVSSASKEGIIDKDQKYLSDELYQKLKNDFEPKIGEILLTKDATPGITYVLKESIEGIICGGILKLKTKENIEPEFLALCINSIIGKSQVERDAGGSIISHWKPEQIKNLQIPILPKPIQQKIADLVQKSHEARKKAKELLEEAKRKVEELIEK